MRFIELAHRIRRRQFAFGRKQSRQRPSLKHLWDCVLAQVPPSSHLGFQRSLPAQFAPTFVQRASKTWMAGR